MAFLFAGTLLLSSALLFLVQPMVAKMVLPVLGGAPAVWNTCMVFFQAGLLAGYAGAHFLPRWLGLRGHALLHVAALAASFLFLPMLIDRDIAPPTHPALWLLGTLLVAAGWPYVVVAASGPLLQKWYSQAGRRDPYYLYAASNLGSFAGLIAYPFLFEPWLSLGEQASAWTWGAGILLLATTICSAFLWRQGKFSPPLTKGRPGVVVGSELLARSPPPPSSPSLGGEIHAQAPSTWQRVRWVLLALVPSSLMLSVTSYVTADIAPIPFLWVLPIAVYLVTFSLVFAQRQLLPHWVMVRWLPAAMIALLIVYLSEATEPITLILGLHLIGFFWCAMVCHGELARTRPPVAHLTEFYLWLAVGGVLGGLLNALVAPVVFSSYVEYPLMLVAACLLSPARKALSVSATSRPWQDANREDLLLPLYLGVFTAALVVILQNAELEPGPLSVAAMFGLPALILYTFLARPVRFGLGLAAVLLASVLYNGINGAPELRIRSFFGVHRVTERDGFRRIMHGNTLHGMQRLDERSRPEPLAYFTHGGPAGKVFASLDQDPRLQRVGIIGLGAGSLAAYAQPGQRWTFFEIDPAVVYLARDSGLFSFLKRDTAIELGDARLSLQKHESKFGLFVVDAFGGDAIPMHLLTQEALQLYLSKLDDDGILLFHISNRHLDLESVLANLAAAAEPKLTAWIAKDLSALKTDDTTGRSPSIWMVLARRPQDLAKLERGAAWRWRPAQPRPDLRPWTDDFSNLLQAFRWNSD